MVGVIRLRAPNDGGDSRGKGGREFWIGGDRRRGRAEGVRERRVGLRLINLRSFGRLPPQLCSIIDILRRLETRKLGLIIEDLAKNLRNRLIWGLGEALRGHRERNLELCWGLLEL